METTELNLDNIEIRLVSSKADLEAVAQFRYQIYCQELGYDKHRADVERKMLFDSLDNRSCVFAAYRGEEIVGTGRMSEVIREDEEYFASLHLDRCVKRFGKVFLATKFMVKPEFRKTSLFFQIASKCYEYSTILGAKAFVVFCYDHLCPTFQKLGFRSYLDRQEVPDFGWVNPIILDNSESNLKAVRSPFLRNYRKIFSSRPGRLAIPQFKFADMLNPSFAR